MQYADVAVATRIAGKDAIFTYAIAPADLPAVCVGALVEVPWRDKTCRGIITRLRAGLPTRALAAKLRPIKRILSRGPVLTAADYRLRVTLAQRHLEPTALALTAGLPPLTLLKQSDLTTIPVDLGRRAGPITFVAAAASQLERLATRIGRAVAQGKTLLLLVPNQQIGRIWQSRLADTLGPNRALPYTPTAPAAAQRPVWQVVFAPRPAIVIGTRAAALLPFRRLDAIILDEPSHPQFHAPEAPYVTALEVALLRRFIWATNLLIIDGLPPLASLLPSQRRHWRFVRSAAPTLSVTIAQRQPGSQLSPAALAALTQDTAAGGRVLIVVPSNAWAGGQFCSDCQTCHRCVTCATVLQVAADRLSLACPICRTTQPMPNRCPHCHGLNLHTFGFGSHRWQAELQAVMPHRSCTLLDKQTLDQPWQIGIIAPSALRELRPTAAAVIAIEPERLLGSGSYQAYEHWLHFLARLRRAATEQLVIETTAPQLPELANLTKPLPLAALQRELVIRDQYGYPPFGEILYLKVAQGVDQRQFVQRLVTALPGARPAGQLATGPFAGWWLVKLPTNYQRKHLRDWLDQAGRAISDWYLEPAP